MNASGWAVGRRMRGLGLWNPVGASPGAVVERLTAMQAQEFPYALWSIAQRSVAAPARSAMAHSFDAGEILRTHVLRPTWHFVAPADLPWLIALSGPRVIARSARRYEQLGLDAATLARADGAIAEAVAAGPRTRYELGAALEARRISPDGQRLAHVVMHAELRGVVCSGPMRGKQHTYAAFDARVSPITPVPDDEALAELARRYFATRGPATLLDYVWWSGLSTVDARRGLGIASADLASCTLDGRTYWLADDDTTEAPEVCVDLVQCYDEIVISYSDSRDVLYASDVGVTVPGRVDGYTHVVLVNGQVAGHWRPSGSGHVDVRPARELSQRERAGLDEAIERYLRFVRG